MLVDLSEQLLFQVKLSKSYETILTDIQEWDYDDLQTALATDDIKKAFWINIYNALFLILKRDLDYNKPQIYKEKLIVIAGKKLSLDDIEHGILRRFRYKYSLGYIRRFFVPKIIKALAVDTLDYRIHFALNCGAKSCPPIAFYSADKIESQLSLSELSFIEGETEINHGNKTVSTSMILNWYRGDFGGVSGIQKILTRVLQKDLSEYKIGFKPYDWEEDLNNYQ